MDHPWGFGVIRTIGHTDLGLDCSGDSHVNYIAPTNYLKTARSSHGATYVDAGISSPRGTIEIAARPEQTRASLTLHRDRITIEAIARTKSDPSFSVCHSLAWTVPPYSLSYGQSFFSNPLASKSTFTARRPFRDSVLIGRLKFENFQPSINLFVDSEFAKGRLQLNWARQRIACQFGFPNAFLCFSLARTKLFKVGGFAELERIRFGASGTTRSLRVFANAANDAGSLSGFYERTPTKTKATIAGSTTYSGTGLALKYDTPDLITSSVKFFAKKIDITIASTVRFGGETVWETVRYGIDVDFLGDD
jgi:hypothetical protein